MFQTLDTIISILFVFLMFSLVVSAAREVVAAWLRLRGKALEAGLNTLLGKLGETKLAGEFWAHPFIRTLKPTNNPPSYIPSANIAAALLHIAAGNKPGEAVDLTKLKTGLPTLAHKNLSTILATAIEQTGAGATLAQVQANLEKWVDGTMERVSSLYQRKTRIWLFLISLGIAAAMNVDAVTIWQRIQSDKTLRDSLVAQAAQIKLPDSIQTELKKVDQPAGKGDAAKKAAEAAPLPPAGQTNSVTLVGPDVATATKQYRANLSAFTDLGLPLGWTDEAIALYSDFGASVLHVLGILASAFAASLGAPFWFDLLQRFMNIRSAIKPAVKPELVSGK